MKQILTSVDSCWSTRYLDRTLSWYNTDAAMFVMGYEPFIDRLNKHTHLFGFEIEDLAVQSRGAPGTVGNAGAWYPTEQELESKSLPKLFVEFAKEFTSRFPELPIFPWPIPSLKLHEIHGNFAVVGYPRCEIPVEARTTTWFWAG